MKSHALVRHSLIFLIALGAAGCSTLCDLRDYAGQPIPAEFTGTVATNERPSLLARPVVLTRVDSTSCRGFDRVVFEFAGPDTPGYRISYIDKPIRQCGSGEVVPVAGDAWLELKLLPAQAHTEAGEATIAERNRQLGYPNLRQLVETCDFEGLNTWVLGLGSPNRYRIFELSNPPRIVVDVKQ